MDFLYVDINLFLIIILNRAIKMEKERIKNIIRLRSGDYL